MKTNRKHSWHAQEMNGGQGNTHDTHRELCDIYGDTPMK
jgi:hypothetical protein